MNIWNNEVVVEEIKVVVEVLIAIVVVEVEEYANLRNNVKYNIPLYDKQTKKTTYLYINKV